MNSKGRISYLANPALGLVTLLLYTLLVNFINYKVCLVICLILSILSLKSLRIFLRNKVFPIFLFISVAVFAVGLLVSLWPVESMVGRFLIRLLPEYLILGFSAFAVFHKNNFVRYMYRLEGRYLHFPIKTNLYEYFFLFRIILYTVLPFVILAFGYILILNRFHSPEMHTLFLGKIRFLMLVYIYLACQLRLYWLNRRFRNEEWLPIIDENAQVIGRIAASVSYQFKERYLHPHIRILVFYKGMIYLRPREHNRKIEIGLQDTPLARDMRFMQDVPFVVDSLMKKGGFPMNMNPRFFSRYLFEGAQVRRMIFLYTLIVPNESYFSNKAFQKGKLWTEQEIENNIGKGVFSSVFEEEFELLKTAVFPIMKMMS